jgi:outer membrane protein assembly factor BamA
MIGLVFLAACLAPADAHDEPPGTVSRSVPATERMFHVGQIYIDGADDMSASAILNTLGFHVGDQIPYRRLRTAERRLADLGLFVVDPALDVRPQIIPCQSGDVANVRVVVVKRATPLPSR